MNFNDRRKTAMRLLQPHEERPIKEEYREQAAEVLAKSRYLPLEGIHTVNVRPAIREVLGFTGAFAPQSRDLFLPEDPEKLPITLHHEWVHVMDARNRRRNPDPEAVAAHATGEGRGDRSVLEHGGEVTSGYLKFANAVHGLRHIHDSAQFEQTLAGTFGVPEFLGRRTAATTRQKSGLWVSHYETALSTPLLPESPEVKVPLRGRNRT